MKRALLGGLAACALVSLALPLPAAAEDWMVGVRGGATTEESMAMAGFEGLTRIGASRWYFNPNAEAAFGDTADAFSLNGDFHYDFDTAGPIYVWTGAGPALLHRSPDRGDGETDPGLNLLAGIGFNKGREVVPYLQGKIVVADDSEAVIALGVRF